LSEWEEIGNKKNGAMQLNTVSFR